MESYNFSKIFSHKLPLQINKLWTLKSPSKRQGLPEVFKHNTEDRWTKWFRTWSKLRKQIDAFILSSLFSICSFLPFRPEFMQSKKAVNCSVYGQRNISCRVQKRSSQASSVKMRLEVAVWSCRSNPLVDFLANTSYLPKSGLTALS